MRFSFLFALLIATFIACTSFTAAKSVDTPARRLKGTEWTEKDEERNLQATIADDVAGGVAKAIGQRADDAVETVTNNKQTLLQRFEEQKKLSILKQADDMNSNIETLAMATAKEAKKVAQLDKQQQNLQDKLTKMAAQAGGQKVPWSKTKKLVVYMGGAALGATGLYAIYKAYVKGSNQAPAVAPSAT